MHISSLRITFFSSPSPSTFAFIAIASAFLFQIFRRQTYICCRRLSTTDHIFHCFQPLISLHVGSTFACTIPSLGQIQKRQNWSPDRQPMVEGPIEELRPNIV